MPKHILIVDDDVDIVQATESRLKSRGFEVSTALTGAQALQVIAQKRPDLVISDVLMPEMDGFEFYKEFRKIKGTAGIPVIILTARGEMEDTFRTLGVDEFVYKPFLFEELLLRVEAVLGKKTEKHILVAGDFNFHKILNFHFKSVQFQINLVKKGDDVIQKAQDLMPRIILVEFFLDGDQTCEVIRALRQKMALKHTTILLFNNVPLKGSNQGDSSFKKTTSIESAKLACIKAGATAYIGQPSDKTFWQELLKYTAQF